MKSEKIGLFLAGMLMVCAVIIAGGSGDKEAFLSGVTPLTEVMGDGQKVAALALEYSEDIDGSSLDASDFSVQDPMLS